MIPDVAGDVATYLRDDQTLMTAVGDAIYTEVVPEDAVPPLIVVSQPRTAPLVYGVSVWDTVDVQVDALTAHDAATDARALIGAVRDLMYGFPRTQRTNAYQSVQPGLLTSELDVTYSPALSRWVLTTTVVVRAV